MHPKALLDACAELVRLTLRFEHPADAVVSRFFRDNRSLGPRDPRRNGAALDMTAVAAASTASRERPPLFRTGHAAAFARTPLSQVETTTGVFTRIVEIISCC